MTTQTEEATRQVKKRRVKSKDHFKALLIVYVAIGIAQAIVLFAISLRL